jgi:hypothetical protein
MKKDLKYRTKQTGEVRYEIPYRAKLPDFMFIQDRYTLIDQYGFKFVIECLQRMV